MFKKTLLLKHKWRITVVVILHLILVVFALSPLLIGVVGMKLEELRTGVTQSEANNALGVLPWFAMFTIAAFWPMITLLFNLTMVCIAHDVIALLRQRRSRRNVM